MDMLDKAYRGLAKALPPRTAGRLDMLRPSYWGSWGGPLNAQAHRRAMVREIAATYHFDMVIETGTYRGTTTEFLAAVFGCEVHTVEANPRFHEFSHRRLACLAPQVVPHLGDSRKLLLELPASAAPVFIYLDAHWEKDLPLGEELRIVSSKWPAAVVMVDDFEVPGDPGYGYDDYGPGRALTADLLPDEVRDWVRLYPAASADAESGARRGSIVLIGPQARQSEWRTMCSI